MALILELLVSSYSQLIFRDFSLMCVLHFYFLLELKAIDSVRNFVCYAVL